MWIDLNVHLVEFRLRRTSPRSELLWSAGTQGSIYAFNNVVGDSLFCLCGKRLSARNRFTRQGWDGAFTKNITRRLVSRRY